MMISNDDLVYTKIFQRCNLIGYLPFLKYWSTLRHRPNKELEKEFPNSVARLFCSSALDKKIA